MQSKLVWSILCSLVLGIFYIQAYGDTYKHIGANGKVTYSDSPVSQKSVKVINLSQNNKFGFKASEAKIYVSAGRPASSSPTGSSVSQSSTPSFVAVADTKEVKSVKWNPGHYISLYPKQDEPYYFNSVLKDLKANPSFKGVQKKYFWNKLEPTRGAYDFSEIKKDLANLSVIKKRLVLVVQAESFITSEKLVPSYLLSHEYEGGVYPINSGKGFNVAYYNTKVQDRMVLLVEALGKEFNGHPYLEAVTFEETSPGSKEPEWHRTYIKNYIAGMLKVAGAANKAFPNTVVIQYVNYPETSLSQIVGTLISSGIGMGGPDTCENNTHLAKGVYTYYPKISGVVPIGMGVDYHNYQSSVGGGGPIDKPSIASIHQFAVAKLKPNYMFWLRRTKEPSNGSNYWQDVLDYFKKFDWQSDPDGGINTNCPKLFKQCNTN